jgi:hypothetical protein
MAHPSSLRHTLSYENLHLQAIAIIIHNVFHSCGKLRLPHTAIMPVSNAVQAELSAIVGSRFSWRLAAKRCFADVSTCGDVAGRISAGGSDAGEGWIGRPWSDILRGLVFCS